MSRAVDVLLIVVDLVDLVVLMEEDAVQCHTDVVVHLVIHAIVHLYTEEEDVDHLLLITDVVSNTEEILSRPIQSRSPRR